MTHEESWHCLETNNEHVICMNYAVPMKKLILLHASHASQQCPNWTTIIIQTHDTDMAVIAFPVSCQTDSQLLLHTDTKHHRRFIDVSSIARNIGINVCKALPGFLAFTGSDSTCAFCVKKTPLTWSFLMMVVTTYQLWYLLVLQLAHHHHYFHNVKFLFATCMENLTCVAWMKPDTSFSAIKETNFILDMM